MKRIIIISLFAFFSFLPAVYAQGNKSLSLETAPVSLKKEFREKTGYEWEDSSFQAREQFYENWLKKKKQQLKQKLQQTQQTTNYSNTDSVGHQESADPQVFQQVDLRLRAKYGSDLNSVSFSIRYLYKKEFHGSWENASLMEKQKFLQTYEQRIEARRNLEIQQKQEEMAREQQRMQEKLQKKQEALQRDQTRAAQQQEKMAREQARQQQFKARIQANQDRAREMRDSN